MGGEPPDTTTTGPPSTEEADKAPTDPSKDTSQKISENLALTRRDALKNGGLFAGGVLAGAFFPESRSEWCTASVPEPYGIQNDFWLAGAHLQQRPLWSLSLPGTHHASFYEMTENWLAADLLTESHVERWTRPQSRDVATQLRDGIRWLDVRVHYDTDAEEALWGHHELARGAPLTEVVADIGGFLDDAAEQAGNELVLVKLSHFDGFEDGSGDAAEAFKALLEEHLGEYALSLPAMEPGETLDRSLSSFDGPRVGLFYEGLDPWPGVADERKRWVRDGWVNESSLDDAHEAASNLTHTAKDQFGEIGYYITPPTARIASSVVSAWIPGSSRWLSYRSLADAAERMGTRFPCFLGQVRLDEALNPNIVTTDFYETSAVVRACQQLSLWGLHGYE